MIKGKQEEEEKDTNVKRSVVEENKVFLFPKDHILKTTWEIGLFGHQLTTKELITEFYTIYNPEN